MNFNEKDVKDMLVKILEDLELQYDSEAEFDIRIDEPRHTDKRFGIKKPWICIINCYDFEFESEDGGYIVSIDDVEPHTILLQDISGSQIPISIIRKDEKDTYFREFVS